MIIPFGLRSLESTKGILPLYTSYLPRRRTFLEKLRQARLEAGLTQVQVAEKLGRPQSYVSKCENGQRRVDFVELLMFAEIYDKALDFFAG